MPEPATQDGRRAKGDRRRALLIEATLRVIESEGIAGVTHRAVAAEAGLPPAAAAYYFRAVDDLLLAALHNANEAYAQALAELPKTGGTAALARLMADLCRTERARVVAECELCLLAVRRPALRPAIEQWDAIIGDYLGQFTDDPITIRAAAAVFEGMLYQALLADRPLSAADFQAVLDRVLT